MAWEWADFSTAAVGIAGIAGTWLTARQGFSNQRQLALDARRQDRLENAYVGLLEMVERVGHWAQIAYPLLDSNPPAPVPELPSLEEQAHTEALVRAFGSNEVLTLMEVWRNMVQKMLAADRIIQSGHEYEAETSPRAEFFQLKPQEAGARKAIADQVAAELGHRKRGS